MSRILWQRLAPGVGAGDVRWIEEWGTAFWKIVRKASSVDKRLALTGLSMKELRGSGAITDTDWTFWPEAVLLFNPRTREVSHVVRFAWTTLYWNVAVILWGAYVRATGSGAGCGNRWHPSAMPTLSEQALTRRTHNLSDIFCNQRTGTATCIPNGRLQVIQET